jgi:hypothetical protein
LLGLSQKFLFIHRGYLISKFLARLSVVVFAGDYQGHAFLLFPRENLPNHALQHNKNVAKFRP